MGEEVELFCAAAALGRGREREVFAAVAARCAMGGGIAASFLGDKLLEPGAASEPGEQADGEISGGELCLDVARLEVLQLSQGREVPAQPAEPAVEVRPVAMAEEPRRDEGTDEILNASGGEICLEVAPVDRLPSTPSATPDPSTAAFHSWEPELQGSGSEA